MHWRVFALMAVGASCLTLGDFVIKQALLTGTSLQQIFGLGPLIFQLLLIVIAMLSKDGWRAHLPLRHPKVMLVRGFIGLLFSVFAFTSLSTNPYTQHAMLMQTGPVIASVLSLLVLGEVFSKRIILVASFSLLGAGLIIGPGSGVLSPWLLLPVLAAAANAAGIVMVARFRDYATGLGFTFWSSWLVTSLGVAWWLVGGAELPSWQGMSWIASMAVFMAIGLVCMSTAMAWAGRLGIASKVPLMMYVQTPVALFFGVLFLQESLSGLAVLGACLILLSGAWMILSQGPVAES